MKNILVIIRSGKNQAVFEADHICDLIGRVLFTIPGERVNHPDFGYGLMQLVFAHNSQELDSTTSFSSRSTPAVVRFNFS